MRRRLGLCLLALSAMVACHNSGRDNPLDPALTPSVTLALALDDTTGIAHLSWSEYEGEAPFESFLVLRNETESIRVDTLSVITDVARRDFADSTVQPNRSYAYRVAVRNASGLDAPSSQQATQGYTVEPIRLTALDPEHGPANLRIRWTRFRSPGFERYRIRRKLSNNLTENIGEVTGRLDTTFTDTSLLAFTNYEWSVVVDTRFAGTGFDSLESNWLPRSVPITAVRLTDLMFDAAQATARLTWRPYEGPRFREYRIVRRTPGLADTEIAQIDEKSVNTFVDSGLVGNTSYEYEVIAITQRDEEVSGVVRGGQFFVPVDEFGLDMEPDHVVRLYHEDDGLMALISSPTEIRLVGLTSTGMVAADDTLVQVFPESFQSIEPRSVAAALQSDGLRALTYSLGGRTILVYLDQNHEIVRRRARLFEDEIAAIVGDDLQMDPLASLRFIPTFHRSGLPTHQVSFDDVRLRDGDSEPFEDSFSLRDPSRYLYMASFLAVQSGHAYFDHVDESNIAVTSDAALTLAIVGETTQRDPSVDLQASVQVAQVAGEEASLRVGSNLRGIMATLNLSIESLLWRLDWRQAPTLENDVRVASFTQTAVVAPGLFYGLSIEHVDETVAVLVDTPVVRVHETESFTWGALAAWNQASEPVLLTTRGAAAETITSDSREPEEVYQSPVSDVAIWPDTRAGIATTAVVTPARNTVAVEQGVIRASAGIAPWPSETAFSTPTLLGIGAGQGNGEFIYPLSIDRGPDGNYYVLDAGNARIQVFDEDGNYVTHFGTKGSALGEFDFGTGRVPEDYAGSIAIDDDGFIYVADPGNRRIQKFAP